MVTVGPLEKFFAWGLPRNKRRAGSGYSTLVQQLPADLPGRRRALFKARSLTTLRKDLKDLAAAGYIIHPGEVRLPLAPGVTALPFSDLESFCQAGQIVFGTDGLCSGLKESSPPFPRQRTPFCLEKQGKGTRPAAFWGLFGPLRGAEDGQK